MSRPRAPRPVLLLLVFGAFMVIVGATASGQAALVTADSQTTLLNAAVGGDVATIRSFVGLNLAPADLVPGGMSTGHAAVLQDGLSLIVERGGILHAALLAPDGTVLVSDDGTGSGQSAPATAGFSRAVSQQQADAAIVEVADAGALADLPTDAILREYLPIIDRGQVVAVAAVWRDAAPILAQLDAGRIHVVAITLTAALISLVLLFFVFRAAQQRLSRQTVQLLEATRRDPLTETLNHGALVEALARRIDTVRADGGAIAVALLDLDNFRLLNDTYGHAAGDHALREVTLLLGEHAPAAALFGRYGPDEFLVVSGPGEAASLEPAMEGLRSALASISLQFEGSERLPVTVSVGIALYPAHGQAVTSLLSAAALTLDEAKASGGDALRSAQARPAERVEARTFDILQGLVIAVDTKDRYTRRHSEEVARYADFLARLLELDDDTRRALHTAGLLHDIGKIGIPDVILRKPGRLTDDEYAIVKQHVTLGDMIVRDLPGIEIIRAGVRHHHERWDGRGYMDALAATDIPLAARILAVGDAFSAMTTTRPYRKALSVEESLRRLEDAAGTQLDEHLVQVFVTGIRTAADAPLPGAPVTPEAVSRIWLPGTSHVPARVA